MNNWYLRGLALVIIGVVLLVVVTTTLTGLANLIVLIVGILFVLAGAYNLLFGASRPRR